MGSICNENAMYGLQALCLQLFTKFRQNRFNFGHEMTKSNQIRNSPFGW